MVECQLPKLVMRVRFPSLAPELRGFFEKILCQVCLAALIGLAGCATTQTDIPLTGLPAPQGVYHKVRKNETLWRIAKAYQMSLEDIIQGNNIPNAAHIEENQLIFIPGASAVIDIPWEDADPHKEAFAWPFSGKILKYFGESRGPYLSKGIDIAAQEGDVVRAARQGKVVFADFLIGHAYTVILDHLDGYYSVYAQGSRMLVNMGDTVDKGAPVVEAGSQGTKTFIHFEIRKKSQADNPLYYLPKI